MKIYITRSPAVARKSRPYKQCPKASVQIPAAEKKRLHVWLWFCSCFINAACKCYSQC